MNYIDKMTEREAKSLLNDICNEFGIGGKVRTPSTILTCLSNAIRRSDCLSRIEHHLSSFEIDEDGESVEDSLLNWGESPDKYIETFKMALDVKSGGL